VHLGLDELFVLRRVRVPTASHAADVLLAYAIFVRFLHIAVHPIVDESAAPGFARLAISAHGARETSDFAT
jgi:hypothetical protein